MRVDPSTSQAPIALTQTEAAASRTANRAGGSTGAATPDAGGFAITDQLAQLLASVRSSPDVRPEAVAAASAKLASGELNTPQAATDTASTFLDQTTSQSS
jgi:hypothetical protein